MTLDAVADVAAWSSMLLAAVIAAVLRWLLLGFSVSSWALLLIFSAADLWVSLGLRTCSVYCASF